MLEKKAEVENPLAVYSIDTPFLSGSRWRYIVPAYPLWEDFLLLWLLRLAGQGFPTPYH